MADPRIPHVIGAALDTEGVAYTKVIFTNLTSGGIQIVSTNADKVAVIDCANFINGYSNGDIIGIENTGASIGGTTVTIDTAETTQYGDIDAAAASTTSNLGM